MSPVADELLFLARTWGLRSNVWRRRGNKRPGSAAAPDDLLASLGAADEPARPEVSAHSSRGAAPPPLPLEASLGPDPLYAPRSGPGLLGVLAPLDRTVLRDPVDPPSLLVSLHNNMMPRIRELGEQYIQLQVSVRHRRKERKCDDPPMARTANALDSHVAGRWPVTGMVFFRGVLIAPLLLFHLTKTQRLFLAARGYCFALWHAPERADPPSAGWLGLRTPRPLLRRGIPDRGNVSGATRLHSSQKPPCIPAPTFRGSSRRHQARLCALEEGVATLARRATRSTPQN